MALSFLLPFSLKRFANISTKALFPDFTNRKTNGSAENNHFVKNV